MGPRGRPASLARRRVSCNTSPPGLPAAPDANRMVVATPRQDARKRPKRIARTFKPIIIVFAALYFLIDAIFFSLIRPLGTWLSKLPIFTGVGEGGFGLLGPYSTLALFAVPLIVLEPIKPVGLLSRRVRKRD